MPSVDARAALRSARVWLIPVVAAWVPLLVFAPCAYSMTLALRD